MNYLFYFYYIFLRNLKEKIYSNLLFIILYLILLKLFLEIMDHFEYI